MSELIKAFVLIFIAEMGDKTQILAMAFATRFPVKKVLFGIFVGVLLNHGLAVALGSYISMVVPMDAIQIIAGFAFIGFAIWTLKPEDDEDDENNQGNKVGPVLTVAIAFFIGELGDKTQLTAITLSTTAQYPLLILAGTVLGMTFTGGIGIFIGKKLGDKIPEFFIKIAATFIFLIFGALKLYSSVPTEFLTVLNITLFTGIVLMIVTLLLRKNIVMRNEGRESKFIKQSRELYEFYNKIDENINKICLKPGKCGKCSGDKCMVGNTKSLIKNGLDNNVKQNIVKDRSSLLRKDWDKDEAINGLKITLDILKEETDEQTNQNEYKNIHEIRKNFENIIFGIIIDEFDNFDEYKKSIEKIDKTIYKKIFGGE